MAKIIIIIVTIYMLALGYLYFWQDKLIFKNSYANPYIPQIAKLVEFKTSDGLKLEGGYIEHEKGLPLVLYFGGNAANVLYFLDNTASKIKRYNFIAFNYPGYANSQGKPSEEAILKYALEISKKYKPQHIIGRSLGTAVASFVASKIEVNSLLLITPFDSIADVAQSKYPIFPIKLIVKHKFNELEWLQNSKAKQINALFVKNDEVIPLQNIEHLKNSVKFDKTVTIDSSHNYIYEDKNVPKQIEELLKDTSNNSG